jgi:hypothetical protein
MNKLKLITSILQFFKWTFALIGVVALIIMIFIKDEPIIVGSPTVSIIDDHIQNQLNDVLSSSEKIALYVEGISAEMELTWQLRLLKVFAIIVVFTYILWILQIILKIVQDVRQQRAFSQANVNRLKHASWLLILSPILSTLLHLLFLLIIGNTYQLPEGYSYRWIDDIDFDFMVIGFLLYAIAIAFEEGLKMKNENELTI